VISDADVERVIARVMSRLEKDQRHPVSTYRLQLSPRFGFAAAAALVPYLHELGITDVYTSPYLKARPGSEHGYDITDHNALNPELGTPEDYQGFVSALHEHGMGHMVDFVPNHMSVFDNPWWANVLENGPASPYAAFFDIDWYPQRAGLNEKVLLPILDDHYGAVLDNGGLRLDLADGAFSVACGAAQLPIDPRTYPMVLEPCLGPLQTVLGPTQADFLEMQSIVTACRNLPARSETGTEAMAERQRENAIIRSRLGRLCERSAEVKDAINEAVGSCNGIKGNSRSFDRLHALLDSQAYRLSFWRTASDEINYRRFFDINDLVGLRMEDSRVFAATHTLLLRLLTEGSANAVRIDQVDGLLDPEKYLETLQQAYVIELCWQEAKRTLGVLEEARGEWEDAARRRLTGWQQAPGTPLFVTVEKILAEKEALPETWAVNGTTGYEFAVALNGIFVNRRNGRALRRIYQWFTAIGEDFDEVACRSRGLIMQTSMGSELAVLARHLKRVADASRRCRDFTLNSLSLAISEIVACFPVYRTYIRAADGSPTEVDTEAINRAVSQARRRSPTVSSALLDFVRDMLLLRYPEDLDEKGHRNLQEFVMRFQQFTGPIMAKGVEDTAFYIYHPLASLDEVGSNPGRFGTGVEQFHRQNIARGRRWPSSPICTSTHDSKRSDDVRARLNVLSEIPSEWRAALVRWRRLNRSKKPVVRGVPVPDPNGEYLLYQTLLGTLPAAGLNAAARERYVARIQDHLLKAIREAKVHTSWISPDADYERGVLDFVSVLLNETPSGFLADFARFHRLVARCGMYNSLSQAALRCLSPGTPDMYQGTEMWSFTLVDPDNRGPVDFARRARLLHSLDRQATEHGRATLVTGLMKHWIDGAIKLYVTSQALRYRRGHAELFKSGHYVPLQANGPRARHVCSFGWYRDDQRLLVLAPRLVARLTRCGEILPLSAEAWGETSLVLPKRFGGSYRNILTDETTTCASAGGQCILRLAEVLRILPVAVLVSASA